MFGGIEAGGTKFVCAVADDNLKIIARVSIPTTTPNETMKEVLAFFAEYEIKAFGVGSFGPIDINPKSAKYGFITKTPKLVWQDYDFVGALKQQHNVPIAWTTDVNAAAYGELKKGAAIGKESCLYLTVGTGVGGGAVVNQEVLTGFGHPEMGHLLIRPHVDDTFQGNCPFHQNCLEGMAAGPAIEARLGKKGQGIPKDDPSWAMVADYLAQALMSYTLTLSPEMIILGGGVMNQQQLFPLIRQKFSEYLAGYVSTPDLERYIVPCGLVDESGITGCLLLAEKELNN